MTSRQVLRFGTRGSALALAQTDLVMRRLLALHPVLRCEVVVIQTEGDRDKETPLTVIGGRGVFTNALQDALRRNEIDVAVHSAKDLPTEGAPDLKIAAFLERADPRDVFISRHGLPLAELGPNPVIGTSSRRRMVQVRKLRPDVEIVDLRGNIDTRMRKAAETELDGIVLAAAGIERMGWSDRITEYLPLEIAVPSPGQGALAVEIRADDIETAGLINHLDDQEVSVCVKVERAFLQGIGGGCTSPIGAYATNEGDRIGLRAMIGRPDGSHTQWINERLPINAAESAAFSLANALLQSLELPLADKRVLVTRGDKDDFTAVRLSSRGATPVVAPVTRIELLDSTELDAAINAQFDRSFDWIVFTSCNAVDALLSSPAGLSIVSTASIAAVGVSTATRLRDRGFEVALQPPSYSAEAVVTELKRRGISGATILFPHGDLARPIVPDGLRAAGAAVETLNVYRTVTVDAIDSNVVAQIANGTIDAAMFCSPSSVRALSAILGDQFESLKTMTIACIGPTTAQAARASGLPVHVVPDESTIEALIDALEKFQTVESEGEGEPVGMGSAKEGGQFA